MSINNMKTVVLSRFLCYMTIINAKYEDEEHNFKCHILPIRFIIMQSLNAKIGKLPMFSTLRFFKRMFSFSGF